MGHVGGRRFSVGELHTASKTSSANGSHLNVWDFYISAAEFPQQKKRLQDIFMLPVQLQTSRGLVRVPTGWLQNVPDRKPRLCHCLDVRRYVLRHVTSEQANGFCMLSIMHRLTWITKHTLNGPIIHTLHQNNITHVSIAANTPIIQHMACFKALIFLPVMKIKNLRILQWAEKAV